MSAFKALREVSNNFEKELRQVSTELFSAKIGESFEETASKKIREISLFSSKLRLLQAKTLAATPQIKENLKEDVLKEYGEVVTWRVLEQMSVKALTQMHAVKALITSPNTVLDPEQIARKECCRQTLWDHKGKKRQCTSGDAAAASPYDTTPQYIATILRSLTTKLANNCLVSRLKKIIESLMEYRHKETELRHLDILLKEKEDEHAALRVEWDREVAELRELRERRVDSEEVETSGPLYKKLRTVVDKLELMRWLVGRLVIARASDYDWLADPHRRLAALQLTRTINTVEMFTQP